MYLLLQKAKRLSDYSFTKKTPTLLFVVLSNNAIINQKQSITVNYNSLNVHI